MRSPPRTVAAATTPLVISPIYGLPAPVGTVKPVDPVPVGSWTKTVPSVWPGRGSRVTVIGTAPGYPAVRVTEGLTGPAKTVPVAGTRLITDGTTRPPPETVIGPDEVPPMYGRSRMPAEMEVPLGMMDAVGEPGSRFVRPGCEISAKGVCTTTVITCPGVITPVGVIVYVEMTDPE